ncbi:hypothetical protein [Bathymodiolus platifrons methanotrophic gill symbiont]|uniref:hypothetical protein n=1 Tax=Bathymodiolus platifrons methanotrophic gill symbiont TaxID=113268 RepID=UPI001C8E3E06|nr:hypothetical protein [Bathymodiolus platifrons methanotrophic gill symbiont]
MLRQPIRHFAYQGLKIITPLRLRFPDFKRLLAHVESANCPVAYQGLKITTSLSSVSRIFSDSHRYFYLN